MLTTESEDLSLTLSIDTPAIVQGYYDQTGVTATTDRVVVLAEIFPDPRADYAATLMPASGDGPYYYRTS